MTKNHPTPPPPAAQTGIIYVGRTDGEMPLVFGKIGFAACEKNLPGRVDDFNKPADRIFCFELQNAYAVELKSEQTPRMVEQYVLDSLKARGLPYFGENHAAPDASMLFLAREVEAALRGLGQPFVKLDVENLRKEAMEHNRKVWSKIRKRMEHADLCPYEAWLYQESIPYHGLVRACRPSEYAREVLGLGYLLRDLAAGSGLEQLEVPLIQGGKATVFPSTLEAAMFEAQAEACLELPTTTRFTARPKHGSDVSESLVAMEVLLGQNLEKLKIQNTFLSSIRSQTEGVKFSPDHLAALGYLGGIYGGACRYEGLGVRARIPANVLSRVRAEPGHLPGVRFWLGVLHCFELGFRLQDFELPEACAPLWEALPNAALLLATAGTEVPKELQSWVAHAWFPALTK